MISVDGDLDTIKLTARSDSFKAFDIQTKEE